MTSEEQIEIFDGLGRPTGQAADRSRLHIEGIWHSSTHVWFIDKDNKILLQKRSMQKKIFPGLWVAPVSGHITFGSNAVDTALQEASEELDIKLTESDMFFQSIIRGVADDQNSGLKEREYINVFIITKEFDINLDMRNAEVDGFKWFSFEEFQNLVSTNDKSLAPAWEEYDIVVSYIKRNRI